MVSSDSCLAYFEAVYTSTVQIVEWTVVVRISHTSEIVAGLSRRRETEHNTLVAVGNPIKQLLICSQACMEQRLITYTQVTMLKCFHFHQTETDFISWFSEK